jgi:YNFM family putative membrane transporter
VSPSWTLLLVARPFLGVTLAGQPAVAMTYLSEEVHREPLVFAMGLAT